MIDFQMYIGQSVTVSSSKSIPPAAAQYRGNTGIVTGVKNKGQVSSTFFLSDQYWQVTFPDGQARAYLAEELDEAKS